MTQQPNKKTGPFMSVLMSCLFNQCVELSYYSSNFKNDKFNAIMILAQ